MADKKMRAYQVNDEHSAHGSFIVYAKTNIQAKMEIVSYLGYEITDVSCYRLPWADKYGSFEKIPKKELINEGWQFECGRCKAVIDEDLGYFVNTKNKVFCNEICGSE